MSQGFWPLLTWASAGDYYWHVTCVLHLKDCTGRFTCYDYQTWMSWLLRLRTQLHSMMTDGAYRLTAHDAEFVSLGMLVANFCFIYAESLPGLISAIQVFTHMEKQPHEWWWSWWWWLWWWWWWWWWWCLTSSNHHMMVISRFNKVMFTGHMKLTPKPRAFWLGWGWGL